MSWNRCSTPAGDEDDRSGRDGADLVADRDLGPARHHDVELVLGVRRLRVGRAGLEHVQPARQVRHGHELVVRPAAGHPRRLELVELPSIHRPRAYPTGHASCRSPLASPDGHLATIADYIPRHAPIAASCCPSPRLRRTSASRRCRSVAQPSATSCAEPAPPTTAPSSSPPSRAPTAGDGVGEPPALRLEPVVEGLSGSGRHRLATGRPRDAVRRRAGRAHPDRPRRRARRAPVPRHQRARPRRRRAGPPRSRLPPERRGRPVLRLLHGRSTGGRSWPRTRPSPTTATSPRPDSAMILLRDGRPVRQPQRRRRWRSGRTATCTSATGDGGGGGDPLDSGRQPRHAARQGPAHRRRPRRAGRHRPALRDPGRQPVRRHARRATARSG